ncbi:hypothetical protein GCM10017673_20790 [Streptosporangium violaceochromogenes]|nr:hypothetical protein GCM10017673_20790 [Streptosporangium violaceochromogenes]
MNGFPGSLPGAGVRGREWSTRRRAVAAGAPRRSAVGLGGQPFRLPVQGLDENELQPEIVVDEAFQNFHSGLLTTQDASRTAKVHTDPERGATVIKSGHARGWRRVPAL